MAESTLTTLYENRDAKCKNAECNHVLDSHFNLKKLENPISLCYTVPNVVQKAKNAN